MPPRYPTCAARWHPYSRLTRTYATQRPGTISPVEVAQTFEKRRRLRRSDERHPVNAQEFLGWSTRSCSGAGVGPHADRFPALGDTQSPSPAIRSMILEVTYSRRG